MWTPTDIKYYTRNTMHCQMKEHAQQQTTPRIVRFGQCLDDVREGQVA
jgi:hypothetical protein